MDKSQDDIAARLVASPCCLPKLTAAELYPAFRDLGFTKLEAFSGWAACRLDWRGDAEADRKAAEAFGLRITSYHLPVLADADETSLSEVVAAARYASRLGARIALFKARTRDLFREAGLRILDQVEKEKLDITLVLQNHKGSSISTLEDFRQVISDMGDDPRIKAVLEVGHFQRLGISWREGWNLLEDRIALIHVNEIRAGKSVPYGKGEVDFAGLLKKVRTSGYAGNIVVELELETNTRDAGETLAALTAAKSLLEKWHREGGE